MIRLVAALKLFTLMVVAVPDPGSRTDLWDVSQGAAVTSHSGVWFSDVAITDMFGTTDSFLQEYGQVVFADGGPEGSVHFVEWQTLTPVLLGRFALHASGDPTEANQREFSSFTLKAKSLGSSDFDVTLFSFDITSHPYQFENASDYLLVSSDVAPTLAQHFRAEFVQWNAGRGFDAPRVIELDGFAPVPDAGSTATALIMGLATVSLTRRNFRKIA